jgi:spore protease
MGQTGIETAELISALVRQISFSSIIAVDALAARSMGRLGATVQFSTSGIAPGSGVHNRRTELSERTLGIPVFSLGIPTVVDAVTMMRSVCSTCEPDKTAQALIVTPRDIDRIIAQGSRILATAINRALQPALSADDIDLLMED